MSDYDPCPSAESHADTERTFVNPDAPGQREWLREQAQIGRVEWFISRGMKRTGNRWDGNTARTER